MYIFLDLETGGFNPDLHPIMEIAVVVVDNQFNAVFQHSEIVRHENPTYSDWVKEQNLWLIDQCRKTCYRTPEDIEADLVETLGRFTTPGTQPMCGYSIHFDRSFLKEHMTELHDFFSHRNVDVSSFTEVAKRNGTPFDRGDRVTHRALDDVKCSIEELRAYLSRGL